VHDLKQAQADEIKVTPALAGGARETQKGTFWMTLAIWVQPRLWIGGVVSPKRDLDLIQALADKVKQMALCRPLLLAVDGLSSYVSAFRNAFRSKLPRTEGETGRCKMVAWQDIAIVQVVKQRVEGVLHVDRRIVQGAKDLVERLIQATQGKGVINTAFIERLNATFSPADQRPDTSYPQFGATGGDLDRRYVPGRLLLQLLRLSQKPAFEIVRRFVRPPLGTTHPSHCRRLDRPPVAACRIVPFQGSFAALGTAQTAR
jgi:hypothetical protein